MKVNEKEKQNPKSHNEEKKNKIKRNHDEKTKQNEQGITLVALIVTIIILLILAGVAIASVTGDNGLFRKAREATNLYKDAERDEQGVLSRAENELSKLMNPSGTEGGSGEENPPTPPDPEEPNPPEEPKPPVDPTRSYVGYYADIEGDGTVDGVIYADLAKGNTGSGNWGTNSNGTYTIPTITGTKNYYINQKDYPGPFGTKDVLSPKEEGLDRFYIMKLNDFTNENGIYFCWYDAAHGNMNDSETYTSRDFGTGKKNTADIITKWNAGGYGAKDDNETYKDIWGQVQEEVNKGWFIPSRAEWAAFGGELGITTTNYSEKELKDRYWSSSQDDYYNAWNILFDVDYINNNGTDNSRRVRLSTTF